MASTLRGETTTTTTRKTSPPCVVVVVVVLGQGWRKYTVTEPCVCVCACEISPISSTRSGLVPWADAPMVVALSLPELGGRRTHQKEKKRRIEVRAVMRHGVGAVVLRPRRTLCFEWRLEVATLFPASPLFHPSPLSRSRYSRSSDNNSSNISNLFSALLDIRSSRLSVPRLFIESKCRD